MTNVTAAPSRASSIARSARAPSAARTITKRRDKPYKTETQRVMARKKRLKLADTFQEAPPGFQYLAVGTPDLAERCKELSRLRGFPVTIVHGRPRNSASTRFDKVSGHIHRIGYHFQQDVLRTAAQELGYVFHGYDGTCVKAADVQAQNEESAMAKLLKKHGIALNKGPERESREQIQAAVRELFPKIPQEDLEFIYDHAWERNTNRVGTRLDLPLSSRVQLAVGSRVRHTYTDYDKLLKVFGDWQGVRAMVEPYCVKKLIEWRGELEDGDEFEEIVRETIIIDDEDEDGGAAVDVDDDSADSDTSIEIVHRPAAAEDIGAESHDEQSRHFLQRYLPKPSGRLLPPNQQSRVDVRQKIDLARSQMQIPHRPNAAPEPRVVQVTLPPGQESVIIGGERYQRARPAPDIWPSIEQASGSRRSSGDAFTVRTNDEHRNAYIHGRSITSEDENRGKRRKMEQDATMMTQPTTTWTPPGQQQIQSQSGQFFAPARAGPTTDFGRDSPHWDHGYRPGDSYHTQPNMAREKFFPVHPVQQSIEQGSTSVTTTPPRMQHPARHNLVHAQVAPIQYAPSSSLVRNNMPGRFEGFPGEPVRQIVVVDDSPSRRTTLPRPVHGAPAPVQQLQRYGAYQAVVSGPPSWSTGAPPPPPPQYQYQYQYQYPR
ncbi:unnamed protein product [Zymoseptoria tritici ST99CH_1A5]|uniref:DUF2293 domain-containing protein n=1 Tax=Zymoseptoria tritici ST99CH_1A5 TaxID=1276529 RepID=A0A1Y6L614_ZYMTR|nr:unnamed protein product [Zymoseptoria tritici ST99CH_1A5]